MAAPMTDPTDLPAVIAEETFACDPGFAFGDPTSRDYPRGSLATARAGPDRAILIQPY
jgi:hypothetical protein